METNIVGLKRRYSATFRTSEDIFLLLSQILFLNLTTSDWITLRSQNNKPIYRKKLEDLKNIILNDGQRPQQLHSVSGAFFNLWKLHSSVLKLYLFCDALQPSQYKPFK